MPLSENTIKRILKEYKEVFDILLRYDETREWPIGRARIDITLDKRIIKKLKDERERTGKPVSQIIEEAVAKI
jgi:hypothetical protein